MFYKKSLVGVAVSLLLTLGQLSVVNASSGNALENFESGYFLGTQIGIHSRVSLGYNFNPYFALEGGVGYLHPIVSVIATAGLTQVNIFTFDVAAKATLPLEKISSFFTGWNLYGKAGPSILAGKVKRILWVSTNDNVSGIIPYVAIGLGYNFNKHIGLDLIVSDLGPAISLSCRF